MKRKSLLMYALVVSLVFSNNGMMVYASETNPDSNVEYLTVEDSTESEDSISEIESTEDAESETETEGNEVSSEKTSFSEENKVSPEEASFSEENEQATEPETESASKELTSENFFEVDVEDFNSLTELEQLSPIGDYSIMAAAAIKTHPKNVAVNINDTSNVEMKVAATGTGLKYQWQECSRNSSTFRDITGSYTATLKITPSISLDNYKYRCVVTDKFGNKATSNAATLRVLDYRITSEPQNVTVTPSDTAKLTVVTNGSGVKYQWQRYITDEYDTQKWSNINDGTSYSGTKNSTLSIVAKGKSGFKYRCIVTEENGLKLTSQVATLHVSELNFSTQPKDQKIWLSKGSQVSFSVSASGASNYQWQESSNGSSWNNVYYTGYNTKEITVPVKASMNNYQYRCVASNSSGSSINSNAAKLSVSDLKITTQPSDKTVGPNDKPTLTVGASGYGLKYQWQAYTQDASTGEYTWSNISTSSSAYSGVTTSTLNILTPKNLKYRCKVTDELAYSVISSEAKITVSKLSITTHPSNAKAKVGTNTSVTFTVKASGSNLKYQWMVSTNNGSSWSNSSESGYSTASLSVAVAASKNNYQYKCCVTDGAGYSVYSNAAVLSVSNLAITTQPTSQTVTGTDTATFIIKASGNGLKYKWQKYVSSSSSWSAISDGTTYSGVATSTLKITNGINGNIYRCVVTDEYSYRVISNSVTLTVQKNDIKITSQPKSVSVTSGSPAQFKVTATGTGLTYMWYVKTPNQNYFSYIGGDSSLYTGDKTNTLNVKITAGRNGYQYKCKITDKNGNVQYTNVVTLTVK